MASTAKVNALMAIIYKESPTESMCLERFGRATKLRSHKKKSFPNEQDNNSRYLLIFSLFYGRFIDCIFSRRTPLPKKIEGKI